MPSLRVMLLGGFDARLASGAGLSLPTKKAQALLAYLAVRPGQPHARDKLATLLWGDKSDSQARDRLRHAVLDLRRALDGPAPSVMRIEGQTLAMDPAVVEVDVAAFEGRVAQGTPQALEEAAELYRGDFLLGFSLNEPLFEEWLVAERERLREMALEALARLLAHEDEGASTERAIQTAVRLLALDPLQEAVHRALMRLSRLLVPLAYTSGDRFTHDLALPIAPLAGLQRARELAALDPHADAYKFTVAALVRERNRALHALDSAASIADDLLSTKD